MQKFIPLFPLGMVAFPGEKIHLHIFENRYQQLIKECAADNKPFGILPSNGGEILQYGTEMYVTEVVKNYEGGEMDIVVEGRQAFQMLKLIQLVPQKLYMGAIVSMLENINDKHLRTTQQLEEAITELFQLLEIDKVIPVNDMDSYSYALAHLVGFDVQQECRLLSHPRESVRQRIVLEHLRSLLPGIRQMTEIKQRAKLNGHFRMINPPDL